MTEPELSRRVRVAEVPPEGLDLTITADADERVALARRFGLVAIDALSAEMRVMPVASDAPGTAWRVDGTVCATVMQTCVVSLEPFTATLSEPIEAHYGVAETQAGDGAEVTVEDESPEPLDGDSIDLGELVAQHLALALDPHPRRPGVEPASDAAATETAADEQESPFAALRSWRTRGDA